MTRNFIFLVRMKIAFLITLAFVAPLMLSCQPLAYACFPKTTGEDVVALSKKPDAWFTLNCDDFASADGCSFTSKSNHQLHVPNVDFGTWIAYSLDNPDVKVMSACGSTLLLDGGYQWDGMSLGETSEEELKASFFHDALYEAIQSGAPVNRCDADRVFLAALRQDRASNADNYFWFVRMTGWIYNSFYTNPTLRIVTLN